MTDEERKKRIAELLTELKDLTATPRSDWHAGFEALLRIEAHKYGGRVQIKTEHLLGEEPPRADFVVLMKQSKSTSRASGATKAEAINRVTKKEPPM